MFGEALPLALGIAISPVPVIATILMLLSPRAKAISAAFALGWTFGITLAVVGFMLLGDLLPGDAGTSGGPVRGIVRVMLGCALILLALRTYRRRPHGDDEPALPKWMSAIDALSPSKALALGIALVLANPKNLVMAAGAGLALGDPSRIGPTACAVVAFILLAACTVVGPALAYAIAPERLSRPLDALRQWLARNNGTIMSILLLFLAVSSIGKGIDAL